MKMNEQEVKLEYPNSPPPPKQEESIGESFPNWSVKTNEEIFQTSKEESEGEQGIVYKENGPDKFFIHPIPIGGEKNVTYDKTPVPGVEITAEDLPNVMFNKVEQAFEREAYSEIADYVLWEAEGSDILSEEVLPVIRDFCARAKEIKSKEEGTQLLGEIKKFLKKWK
jgi:hypothetical protein